MPSIVCNCIRAIGDTAVIISTHNGRVARAVRQIYLPLYNVPIPDAADYLLGDRAKVIQRDSLLEVNKGRSEDVVSILGKLNDRSTPTRTIAPALLVVSNSDR